MPSSAPTVDVDLDTEAVSLRERRLLSCSEDAAVFVETFDLDPPADEGDFVALARAFGLLVVAILGLLGIAGLIDELRFPEPTFEKRAVDVVGFLAFIGVAVLVLGRAAARSLVSRAELARRERCKGMVVLVRFDRASRACHLIGPFLGPADRFRAAGAPREPVLATFPLAGFSLRLSKTYMRSLPWSDMYEHGEFDFVRLQLEVVPPRHRHPGIEVCSWGPPFDLLAGIETDRPAADDADLVPGPRGVERLALAERIFGRTAERA